MTKSFDIFLSHNSKDKLTVRELAEALRTRGLKVWLDEWELVPGQPWQEALEEIIETTRSSAVLVGKDGVGPWQDAEMRGCLAEFVDRKQPVIPVLLPGAPAEPKLPFFLRRFTWVDLRSGITEEGLDRLQWGATGKRPDRSKLPPIPTVSREGAVAPAEEAQPAAAEARPTPPEVEVPAAMAQAQPLASSSTPRLDFGRLPSAGTTTNQLADLPGTRAFQSRAEKLESDVAEALFQRDRFNAGSKVDLPGATEKLDNKASKANSVKRILNLTLIFSFIALVLVTSAYLAKPGIEMLKSQEPADLATIFFGASSISLMVFAILVALLVVSGWQSIKQVNQEHAEKVEAASRGRSFANLGYLIGESSITSDSLSPTDRERLEEAIDYCRRGYELLKNTGSPDEFTVLNNLLVYSCVLHDGSKRHSILEGARRLRAFADEHDSPNLLLTYVRTIIEFSLEPTEIAEACSILVKARVDPRLNAKQKREAEYFASLCAERQHKLSLS